MEACEIDNELRDRIHKMMRKIWVDKQEMEKTHKAWLIGLPGKQAEIHWVPLSMTIQEYMDKEIDMNKKQPTEQEKSGFGKTFDDNKLDTTVDNTNEWDADPYKTEYPYEAATPTNVTRLHAEPVHATAKPDPTERGFIDAALSFLPAGTVDALKVAALREGRNVLEQAAHMLVTELKQQGLLKDEDC